MKILNLKELRDEVINTSDFSNFNLTDFPLKIREEIYLSALKKAENYFKIENKVSGLFICGNDRGDGISDLDLLLILKNGGNFNVDFFKMLDPIEKRVFAHNIFCVDKLSFKNFKFMVPFYKITPIFFYGDFKLPEKFLLEKFYGKVFMLKNLISFIRTYIYKEIKVRGLLLLLSGMRYDFKIFKDFFPEYDLFSEKILNLRKNWFNFDENLKTKELFSLYKDAFIKLIDFFENYNLDDISYYTNYFSLKQVSNVYFESGKEKDIFIGIGGKYFSFLKINLNKSTKNPFEKDVLDFFSHLFEFGKNIGGDISLPIPSPFVPEYVRNIKSKIYRIFNKMVMEYHL